MFRKVYDTINTVGRGWQNLNQGTYNSPVKAERQLGQARALLEEVVADWPAGLPDTPAVAAAREYLRREAAV
ncbi:MAG TPA: hypothetical protein VIL85_12335 [Thermomicrobiales bacterium]|jgi:hypothetical protein